jgi:hypothetical protein
MQASIRAVAGFGSVSEMLPDELDDLPGKLSTELNNMFRTLPG